MSPFTHVVLFAAGLGACGCNPSSGENVGPSQSCDAGHIPDGENCVPEACGAGTWGELEVDSDTVYVDIAALEDGDGTEAAPYRSIQAGLDLAGSRGGGLVAVAAGTYAETLVIGTTNPGAHLAGRCRELVTLDASVGDASTPGIDIDLMYGEASVSGIEVSGSKYLGVDIGSGTLRLSRLHIEKSAFVGIGASQFSLAPTNLLVEGCEIVGNAPVGVLAYDSGTTVTLRDTTITDTLPDGSGGGGYGIYVHTGATLMVERSAIERNTSVGVSAVQTGSTVTLVNTRIQDTLTNPDGDGGFGIEAQFGATILAEGCELVANPAAGAAAGSDSVIELVDTTIRGTQYDRVGESGDGILVQDGARLSAAGCTLDGNSGTGVFAYDSATEVVLVDTTIRNTEPDARVEGGYGIASQDGARLTAVRCEIQASAVLGLLAAGPGTNVSLTDSTIQHTQLGGTGGPGSGISVHSGGALAVHDCVLESNARAGLAATGTGTEVVLSGTTIRNTNANQAGELGIGINAQGGPSVAVVGCVLERNTSGGVMVYDSRPPDMGRLSGVTNSALDVVAQA